MWLLGVGTYSEDKAKVVTGWPAPEPPCHPEVESQGRRGTVGDTLLPGSGGSYLQEGAGQVVLGAENPHPSHSPHPALARRRLWAAFESGHLCTVCREREQASGEEALTSLNPARENEATRPEAHHPEKSRPCRALGQEPRHWPRATISPGPGTGQAGTSPGGQGGCEQGVESLASGRSSLVLNLDQVGHVICGTAAG